MGNIEWINRKEEQRDFLKMNEDDPYSFDSSIKRMDQKLAKKRSSQQTFNQTLSMDKFQKQDSSENLKVLGKKKRKSMKNVKTPKPSKSSKLRGYSDIIEAEKDVSFTPKVVVNQDTAKFDFNEIFASEFSRQKKEIYSKLTNDNTSDNSSEDCNVCKVSTKYLQRVVITDDDQLIVQDS